MRLLYIRERSRWSREDLAKTLAVEPDCLEEYVKELSYRRVLKWIDKADGESDSSVDEPEDVEFQFVFVGVVLFKNLCLVLYPKYLPEMDSAEQADENVLRSVRQVIRVLEKYGKSEGRLSDPSTDIRGRSENLLALMLRLLEMYGEYGVYSNYVKDLANNGPGSVSWERTISSELPFLSDGKPIYVDYKTIETNRDDSDFVVRLHRAVLTECSGVMQESGLASLLELDELWLSDMPVEDFGDPEYVLYRLERERAAQFVTWKQDVIDLLASYVSEKDSPDLSDDFRCLGTSSFHVVWEQACCTAFDDSLRKPLDGLGIKLDVSFEKYASNKLIEIIPKPAWKRFQDGKEIDCDDAKLRTLVPDTVLIHNNGTEKTFAILDAKYYTPTLDKKNLQVPGVGDVTKQFLYQRAYGEFITKHEFNHVVNAFLVPTADSTIKHVGRVGFPGVIPEENDPFSNVVEMYALPAEMAFDSYLEDKALDDPELLKVLADMNLVGESAPLGDRSLAESESKRDKVDEIDRSKIVEAPSVNEADQDKYLDPVSYEPTPDARKKIGFLTGLQGKQEEYFQSYGRGLLKAVVGTLPNDVRAVYGHGEDPSAATVLAYVDDRSDSQTFRSAEDYALYRFLSRLF